MKIWIDADACPRPIKEVVCRAGERRAIDVVMVANQPMVVPKGERISLVVVPKGPDIADEKIIEQVQPGDLVVTADVPLAAAIVEKGAVGLSPHGERYTEENVRERLSMRDFMSGLREAGIQTGGPKPFSTKDKHRFSSAFDALLHQLC